MLPVCYDPYSGTLGKFTRSEIFELEIVLDIAQQVNANIIGIWPNPTKNVPVEKIRTVSRMDCGWIRQDLQLDSRLNVNLKARARVAAGLPSSPLGLRSFSAYTFSVFPQLFLPGNFIGYPRVRI